MLENTDDLGDDTPVWHGVLDPSLLNHHAVAAGHRLADAAKAGHWSTVMRLHELPGQHVWFPVPGMYGGFHITVRQGYLDVRSWCRTVGGSGQAHMVTREDSVLVDEGFDIAASSNWSPTTNPGIATRSM